MKKILALIVVFTPLLMGANGGCGAKKDAMLQNAVNYYCSLSPELRAIERRRVDEILEPRKIRIDCADNAMGN